MQIVKRIKSAASKQGYTLAELEQKLGFGVRTIYKWDKNAPSVEKVLAVANFLDISLSWLITGQNETSDLPESFLKRYTQLSENDKDRIDHYMDICLCRTHSVSHVSSCIHESGLHALECAAAKVPTESSKLLKYKQTPDHADYTLIMEDNSMSPLFVSGEYLHIKYSIALKNGDLGVFLRDHQIICRQYLESEGQITLHPFNPAFPEEHYNSIADPALTLIGKVLTKPTQQK